jgi:ankyrin repeat protein
MPGLDIHRKLLSILKSIHFVPQDAGGVCHGVALNWLDSMLTGQQSEFNHLMMKVLDDPDLLEKINEDIDPYKKIRDDAQELLQLIGLFENIAVSQDPTSHSNRFNDVVFQQNIDQISKVSSSEKLKSLGGFFQVYSEAGIYSKIELINYLHHIATSIYTVGYRQETVLGISLMTCIHSVGLSYNTSSRRWAIMDVNQWPVKSFASYEITELAAMIWSTLNIKITTNTTYHSNETYTAFNAILITTSNDPMRNDLKRSFAKLKARHIITKELTERQSADDTTLALIAAIYGHVESIQIMAELGVNFNIPGPFGLLPAHYAVYYLDILKILAAHGADLDRATTDDFATPSHYAALFGYKDVIELFGQHGVNYSQPKLASGLSPLFTAVSQNSSNVIPVLIKYGADVNEVSNGTTPLYVAAKKGFTQVVNALLISGAQINKPTAGEGAPIFAAIRYNRVEVLELLLLHGASFALSNHDGQNPEQAAYYYGHQKIIRLLRAHRESKFSSMFIKNHSNNEATRNEHQDRLVATLTGLARTQADDIVAIKAHLKEIKSNTLANTSFISSFNDSFHVEHFLNCGVSPDGQLACVRATVNFINHVQSTDDIFLHIQPDDGDVFYDCEPFDGDTINCHTEKSILIDEASMNEPAIIDTLATAALYGAMITAVPEAIGDALYLSGYVSKANAEYVKQASTLLYLGLTGTWMGPVVSWMSSEALKKAGCSRVTATRMGNTIAFLTGAQITPLNIAATTVSHVAAKLSLPVEKYLVHTFFGSSGKKLLEESPLDFHIKIV